MAKKRKRKNKKFSIPVAILIIFLIIISVVLDKNGVLDEAAQKLSTDEIATADTILTAHFIDVGQGDCTLFISGDDTMLIDCGESEYSSEVLLDLDSFGVTQLDYVVVTHAHSDHMGGMADIISTIPTDNVIISEPSQDSSETATYEKFLDALDACGAQVILAEAGYTFTFGDAECEVLAPFEVSQTEENNNSLVLYISAGSTSFLMTGDAEKAIEKNIVSTYPNLRADILKVGHHGSKTSSSDDFLAHIQPQLGIISVGANNRYKHPSEDTIQNLDEHGVKYYRTDKCGTITVTCSGTSCNISTER